VKRLSITAATLVTAAKHRLNVTSRNPFGVTLPDLDAWVPRPQVRTRHRREASAAPDVLWEAAGSVRLSDTGTVGRLVRWRIPGVPAEQTFGGLFAADPFTVLAEGEHWSISGLCGRIWTFTRDYAQLDGPDDFRAWDAPRTVRVLMAHWVENGAAGVGARAGDVEALGHRVYRSAAGSAAARAPMPSIRSASSVAVTSWGWRSKIAA